MSFIPFLPFIVFSSQRLHPFAVVYQHGTVASSCVLLGGRQLSSLVSGLCTVSGAMHGPPQAVSGGTLMTIDASLRSLCAPFLPHTRDQSACSPPALPHTRGPPCASSRINTRGLTNVLCAPPPARVAKSLLPRCCLAQAVRAALHVQLSAKTRNGDVGSAPACTRCLPLVYSGGWYKLGWAVRTLLSVPSPERRVPSASVSVVRRPRVWTPSSRPKDSETQTTKQQNYFAK